MKLYFGKHRGEQLHEVPNSYLFWLTCWELDEAKLIAVWSHFDGATYKHKISAYLNECNQARRFLIVNQLNVVWAARKLFERKRICAYCFGKLVPIGFDRANGKNHSDWSSRKLHKVCWSEIR
jgi:hypothetical protein